MNVSRILSSLAGRVAATGVGERLRSSGLPSARPRSVLAVAAVIAVPAVAAAGTATASTHARRHVHAGRAATDPQVAVGRQWYDITDQTVRAAGFPEPVTQSDTWATSWLAAARAVSSSSGQSHTSAADRSSFAIAALAQALHDTLEARVPSQSSQLDADLTSTLASVPDGPAKSAGVAAGQQQAASVLAERSGDGLDTASVDSPFTPPPPGPGVWQPTPPTYGKAIRAGEGKGRPYLLAAADQFDPGPPPSLSSQTYLDALAEVRSVGAANSTTRTAQQTDVAKFWEPAANVQYVQILRGVLAQLNEPLVWQAWFVAAFHTITTDAQIAVYNAKYKYLFWRPVTAIQTGSVDQDPSWTPFFTTPLHPEYPSGHGGYAGAAQEVLTAFLGPDAPAPIDVTSPSDPGSTHAYSNWAAVTQEVIDARVWEGIHFRFSDDTGAQVGKQVADYDLRHIGALAR